MDDISLKDIQDGELDILSAVHNFCISNDIAYYLAGGTLLGAVRHKGFIPWDDDIDIIMPRPDYNRFIELTQDRLEKYVLFHDDGYPANTCAHMKVVDPSIRIREKALANAEQFLWIDVFPMDGMPSSLAEQERHMRKMAKYDYLLWQSKTGQQSSDNRIKYILKNILFFPLKLIGERHFAKKMTELATKYDYSTSEIVGCAVGKYGISECIKKEVWQDRVMLEFEKQKFYASAGYDVYLKNLYGDYMKMPVNKNSHL